MKKIATSIKSEIKKKAKKSFKKKKKRKARELLIYYIKFCRKSGFFYVSFQVRARPHHLKAEARLSVVHV